MLVFTKPLLPKFGTKQITPSAPKRCKRKVAQKQKIVKKLLMPLGAL